MDDLELLMMAAKAIGRKVKRIDGDSRTLCGIFFEDHDPDDYSWNPLTDDGDAMRLAVKLHMQVDQQPRMQRAVAMWEPKPCRIDFVEEAFNGNPVAATRRAIVRAAAEIGKGAIRISVWNACDE